jgi:Ca2+-binding RTX toxin-like protein
VVQTTRGFLTRGTSFLTTINGGEGDDKFQVYGNRGPLALNGDAGNDEFIVRAFLLVAGGIGTSATAVDGGADDDYIEYTVNAPVSIAGGEGADALVVIGTEAADVFTVTSTGVVGAGLTVVFGGIERIEIDGQEGDDRILVLSTPANAVLTLIGGAGSDTFDILAELAGPVVVEGGVIGNRVLLWGLRLPTETDIALPAVVIPVDESRTTDTLNVIDTFSTTARTGSLGHITAAQAGALSVIYGTIADLTAFGHVYGLGAGAPVTVDFGTSASPDLRTFAGGITFHDIEIVDVLLGQGNDVFTVIKALTGVITVVQGGGGNDTLTVLDGGGADAPVIVFGDSSQDGRLYAPGAPFVPAGTPFAAGDDTIDASAATGAVALYGGGGNDRITGSAFSDTIAGGSGDDVLLGGLGADVIHGDDGFNLDLSRRLSLVDAALAAYAANPALPAPGQILLVTSGPGGGDDLRFSDALTAGDDRLEGGAGSDVLFGDHGRVDQVPGVNRLYEARGIAAITSTRAADGGADTLLGGAGDDVLIGGGGGDTITDTEGSSVVIGDSGVVLVHGPKAPVAGSVLRAAAQAAEDALTLAFVSTLDAEHGGDDTITTGDLADLIIGGAGGDVIRAGRGVNLIFGDGGLFDFASSDRGHGEAGDDANPADLDRAESVSPLIGGADRITSLDGDDLIIGGAGADVISAGEGQNVILGDNGRVLGARDDAPFQRFGDLPIIVWSVASTVDDTNAGPDIITSGAGKDLIVGGGGGDTIRPGEGGNILLGGAGTLVFDESARAILLPPSVPVALPPVLWIYSSERGSWINSVAAPLPMKTVTLRQRAS